jgi:hypothetical protein
MPSRVLLRGLAFALLLATLRPAPAAAQDEKMIGARLGLYTKHDQPYFGVEFVLPVGPSVSLNPNVEYVRLGDSQQFTINADLTYEVPIKGRFYGWAGAGIGLLSTHPDGPGEPNTKDGVGNVFVGIAFQAGPCVPYITAKYEATRHSEFLLGLGVRF